MTLYILHNRTSQNTEDKHLACVLNTYYSCNYIIYHRQSED